MEWLLCDVRIHFTQDIATQYIRECVAYGVKECTVVCCEDGRLYNVRRRLGMMCERGKVRRGEER
jgi:hypothetical protein